MSEPRKRCPFCGTPHNLGERRSNGFWQIICECGAEGPLAPSKDDALKDWNYRFRANPPETPDNSSPPLPSALAGVTPEELRNLACKLCEGIGGVRFGWTKEHMNRAATILRALADTLEQTEGKP